MTYQLIRGDATSLPLADDSVDLICTSPPSDGGGETYQRDPFVGGEVPNPVVYRFAEQEDA